MYIHGTGKLHEKHRFNSFADIIESRDDSTGNHVKRTTAFEPLLVDVFMELRDEVIKVHDTMQEL